MIVSADTQFLFLHPLPVTGPGLNARLGALAVRRTDAALHVIEDSSLLRIKMPPYLLPNPIYLFKQQVRPQLTTAGLTEYAFLAQLGSLTAPDHVLPVVFGSRYLFYTDALSLRCFQLPHLFHGRDLLDLKVVLQAARLFGSLPHLTAEQCAALAPALQALESRQAGPAPRRTDAAEMAAAQGQEMKPAYVPPAQRAEQCSRLFAWLQTHDAAILNFCLKGRQERQRRLQQSLSDGRSLVCCDGTHFFVLRCLSFDGQKAQVLRCAPDYTLDRCTVDIDEPILLAPTGILNATRQQRLSFDLQQAEDLLQQTAADKEEIAALPDHSREDLTAVFRQKLTDEEFALYLQTGQENPQLLPRAPLWTSPYFKEIYFLYQADNFRESLISADLDRYSDYCRRRLPGQVNLYFKEAQRAASLLLEDDEQASRLLYEILNYPHTL